MTASDDWDRAEPLTDRDAALADILLRFVQPAAQALLDRWRRGALEPGDVEMICSVLQSHNPNRTSKPATP